MDKKRGLKNVIVSVVLRALFLIAAIVVRRAVIKYVGNAVNGLNSLYVSLLDFLAVAELGVGSAITFCMYKPIVEGDEAKVSALYHLFTRLYLIIGGVILVGGCCIMPFLPYLAKDYDAAGVNLYYTFALMLASVLVTYGFGSKTSLINAHKDNYITMLISCGGTIVQDVCQMVVLVFTRSFVWFLVCRVAASCLQWLLTELYVRYKYPTIIKNKQRVDGETKKEVTKNIKAMFMHRIGGALVNTADSIIISAFIGIVILGKYSNYMVIMSTMTSVLALCFTPLTSVIGQMCVTEDETQIERYLNFFHVFNFILGAVFFLGYYAVVDNVVSICFGGDLELMRSVSFVITLNYFIQFMRQAVMLFRDATGTFYYDRWKPLCEGSLNVVLSIGFVYLFEYLFGDDFAVVGVIAATIVTNLCICHIVEPHVLYKYALKRSAGRYYARTYIYTAVFALALVALNFCMLDFAESWIELLVNGCIAVAIAVPICLAAALLSKDFRHYFKRFVAGSFKKRKA